MNIVNVTICATPRSILRISICNFNLLVFEPHVCVQTNVCTMATSWLSIPGHRPSLFLFRSFCPFFLSFSVCFLYRLLRIYFRFSAFLRGGFCYSAISSRRYTPPALLASLNSLTRVTFRLGIATPKRDYTDKLSLKYDVRIPLASCLLALSLIHIS